MSEHKMIEQIWEFRDLRAQLPKYKRVYVWAHIGYHWVLIQVSAKRLLKDMNDTEGIYSSTILYVLARKDFESIVIKREAGTI